MTAFCVWSSQGRWQGPVEGRTWGQSQNELYLDGIRYAVIGAEDGVPAAYCEADVELDDNGEKFDCMMVSGHVATLVEGELKDTVRPLPAWFMFIKEECEDPDVAEMRNLREQYPDMFKDIE